MVEKDESSGILILLASALHSSVYLELLQQLPIICKFFCNGVRNEERTLSRIILSKVYNYSYLLKRVPNLDFWREQNGDSQENLLVSSEIMSAKIL